MNRREFDALVYVIVFWATVMKKKIEISFLPRRDNEYFLLGSKICPFLQLVAAVDN